MSAVKLGKRPVACFPCALKYFYVDDPTAELTAVMDRLEDRLGLPRGDCTSLAERLRQFMAAAIAERERQFLGAETSVARPSDIDSESLAARLEVLKQTVLKRVEHRLEIAPLGDFLPERVKRIRQTVVERISQPIDEAERQHLADDLEQAFVAVQLYSYRPEYLDGEPSIERIAETIDKYEEDFLGARSANIRGRKRGVIAFGEPLVIDRPGSREDVALLGDALRRRVQTLIDEIETGRQRAK